MAAASLNTDTAAAGPEGWHCACSHSGKATFESKRIGVAEFVEARRMLNVSRSDTSGSVFGHKRLAPS